MRRTLTSVLIGCLAALALASCGEDNKVGNDKLLTFEEQAKKAQLGATSTTTSAPPTTVAAESPDRAAIGKATTTTATPTTEAPQATTTTVAEVKAFEVSVNSDNSGTTQFDPSAASIYVGTLIRFTNSDTVPRSVEADSGEFNSGPIAPGASWTYKATKVGKFNYHDGTRPYAVGALEVVAR
jgi:plastocyanin